MRNLKRVLSLALAAIMLMGMMVIGTSAKNVSDFKDADQIGNIEAASIVSGLEILVGDTSGNFNPQDPVTRAQMATFICKILYGSNVNGNNFKGTGTFADAKTYENGWAEGYINMCHSQGIVNGYNDTTFGAADTVTTWQAALMLERALGYWNAAAGEAINELTVTGLATNLGLYGDLTLSVDAPLTREDVAVLVFNALFAQRVHYDDVRGLYTKDNDRNVVVNNGTNDPANTLAQNTFGLYSVNGIVTGNGYTDINLTDKSRVVFDDATDVTGDGRAEAEYSFEYTTGLDMIGHAATVYYKVVRRAPEVYAVVDKAEKVEQTFVPGNLSTHARDKGFSRDTSETIIVKNYNLENVVSGTGYKRYNNAPMILISNSSDLTVDYAIILDQRLDYVTRLSVDNSDRDNPISNYTLKSNGGLRDDTSCVATGDIAQDSYVIYTEVTSSPKMVVLSPAPVEQQLLTRVDRSTTGTYSNTKNLYTDNVKYSKATTKWELDLVDNEVIDCYDYDIDHDKPGTCTSDYAITPYADVLVSGEYNLIYDEYDRLIAVSPVEPTKATNIAYVAQFGYKINTNPSLNDSYAITAHVYFADGTDNVYFVNNTSANGGLFAGVKINSAGDITTGNSYLPNTYKIANSSDVTVGAKTNVNGVNTDPDSTPGTKDGYVAFSDYIKLYDVTVNSDNTVTLKELEGQYYDSDKDISSDDTDTALAGADTGTTGISQIKKGVTWMGETDHTDKAKSTQLYGNSETVIFYVNGDYNDTTGNNGLTVGVTIGMAGLPAYKHNAIGAQDASTKVNEGVVEQASAVQVLTSEGKLGSYATVKGVLACGYTFVNAQAGIYFYNNSYTVTRVAADDYTLTYHMYDAKTGEAHDLVYAGQYKTDKDARAKATSHVAGYYEDGGKDIAPWTTGSHPMPEKVNKDQLTYVVNSIFKDYIDVGDTLTLYTIKDSAVDVNNYKDGVTITDDTIFVDTTYNHITSLQELAEVIKANQDSYTNAGRDIPEWNTTNPVPQSAKLSYWYDGNLTGDNTVKVLFITSVISPYNKDVTGSGTTPAPTAPDGLVKILNKKVYVYSTETLTPGKIIELVTAFFAKDGGNVQKIDTSEGKVTVLYGNKESVMDLVIHDKMNSVIDESFKPTAVTDGSSTTKTVQDLSSAVTEAKDTTVVLEGTVMTGIPQDVDDVFNYEGADGKPDMQDAKTDRQYFVVSVPLPGFTAGQQAAILVKSAANKYGNWNHYPDWAGEPGGLIDRESGYKFMAGPAGAETLTLDVLVFAGDVVEIQVMTKATGVTVVGDSKGSPNEAVKFNGSFTPTYTIYIDTNGVVTVAPPADTTGSSSGSGSGSGSGTGAGG